MKKPLYLILALLASTLLGIFLVPVSFYVVESWREKRAAKRAPAPQETRRATRRTVH